MRKNKKFQKTISLVLPESGVLGEIVGEKRVKDIKIRMINMG